MNYYYIQSNAIASGPHALKSAHMRRALSTGNPELLAFAALAAAGYYPEWREEGDAPLGYLPPQWEPEVERVAVYRKGTEQERLEAAKQQRLAELSCTRLQARLELLERGLWEAVLGWATQQGGEVQAFFEDAQRWQFTDPSFQAGVSALSLTEDQAVEMMESAATR